MMKIEENRTRRLIIRLKPQEFALIESRFKKSIFRKLSEYTRNVLFEKSTTVFHRDKSMDDILEELILLRKELNFIGNNFNQAVRKLNSVHDMPDAELWEAMLTVLRDELQPSIEQIKNRLNNYSELWSQRLSVEKVLVEH
ncbi:hypothetical protein ABIB40_002947 [Pedobacter sp. UYP30]|uniref:plasmid mobilization protein n=1 Tax=Pedobacter sp. UYP30 TaxID=1756400 RepID=UPI00339A977C